jgi:Ca2+-binding EF-hand superfamily protein
MQNLPKKDKVAHKSRT